MFWLTSILVIIQPDKTRTGLQMSLHTSGICLIVTVQKYWPLLNNAIPECHIAGYELYYTDTRSIVT